MTCPSGDPLLSPVFLRQLGSTGAAELATLEPLLAELVRASSAAWAGVALSPERFVSYLAERMEGPCGPGPANAGSEDGAGHGLRRRRAGSARQQGSPVPAEEALRRLHCTDLYLACACASGSAPALACFERHFLPPVADYVAAIDSSPAFADEVIQILREKLFVAARNARPKILDYRGHGPLGGWLRVAAIRTARNLQRAGRRSAGAPAAGTDVPCHKTSDPQLSFFRRHYQREFRLALERTLTSLPPKQRNVLRLHYLDQLSSTTIGAIYGVSGAAVRKWLKESRRSVLSETRAILGERLGLDSASLNSVMDLVQSQLDLSVSRLLKKTSGG